VSLPLPAFTVSWSSTVAPLKSKTFAPGVPEMV
jgi:hypothetical protein